MINVNMTVDCTIYNDEIQQLIQRNIAKHIANAVKDMACNVKLPNDNFVHPDHVRIIANISNDNKGSL